MDFCDRHVVVTGGTGALGRAVVDALLAAGAHCRPLSGHSWTPLPPLKLANERLNWWWCSIFSHNPCLFLHSFRLKTERIFDADVGEAGRACGRSEVGVVAWRKPLKLSVIV